MDENAIVTFLIFFSFASLHNVTVVRAQPTKMQSYMFHHVRQERLWQDVWFEEFAYEGHFRPIKVLWYANPRLLIVPRLRFLSPMMGCAYGVNLTWFFLLTLEAIDQCKPVSPDENDDPGGGGGGTVVELLEASIERGKFVIVKLLRSLKFVNDLIDDDVGENPFYRILTRLESFLEGEISVGFSGILPGGLVVNQMINEAAEALERFLRSNCQPDYRFNITAKRGGHKRATYTNGICYFYKAELDNHIAFVDNHLIQLGFHYVTNTDRITFDPKYTG